jgi:hypothetical protein
MPYRAKRLNKHDRAELQARYATSPTAFWAWLSRRMMQRDLTESHLAHDLDIDRHNLQAWRRGALPNPHSCKLLADYFHVRLSWVYALAHIPLKADWELGPEDREGLPNLTQNSYEHACAVLARQGYSEEVLEHFLTCLVANSPD